MVYFTKLVSGRKKPIIVARMRNVEVKARVTNLKELVKNAKLLSKSNGTLIKQEDTFFNVPQGRLKLRLFEDGSSVLIYYERPDVEGPKESEYSLVEFPVGSNPTPVLSLALGVKGVLKKARRLFMVGRTRIHIDHVEGLGNFMELEVVLKDEESFEEGYNVAEDLRKKLGIDENDLLTGAYMDMLLDRKSVEGEKATS